jgi:hypothetical protein
MVQRVSPSAEIGPVVVQNVCVKVMVARAERVHLAQRAGSELPI